MSFLVGKLYPAALSLLRPRSVRMSSAASISRAVRVALVQLGNVTADKSHNLQHAREMVLKAASGSAVGKPDLVVLPASISSPENIDIMQGAFLAKDPSIVLGMFQFAVWCELLPDICRDHCIYSRKAI